MPTYVITVPERHGERQTDRRHKPRHTGDYSRRIRRKRRQFVAEFGDSRRNRRLAYSRQCGQGYTVAKPRSELRPSL